MSTSRNYFFRRSRQVFARLGGAKKIGGKKGRSDSRRFDQTGNGEDIRSSIYVQFLKFWLWHQVNLLHTTCKIIISWLELISSLTCVCYSWTQVWRGCGPVRGFRSSQRKLQSVLTSRKLWFLHFIIIYYKSFL